MNCCGVAREKKPGASGWQERWVERWITEGRRLELLEEENDSEKWEKSMYGDCHRTPSKNYR